MCQFNNIVLPANTNIDEVRSLFRKHTFNVFQAHNISLSQQLADKMFLMSPKNQCDCDSVITSARHHNIFDSSIDKEIEKLKRKGWSDTKIKYHFASKQKAAANKNDDVQIERTNWTDLIKEILASGKVNSFGILAHEYEGEDVTKEIITIKAKHSFKVADFSPERLDDFLLDVYYEYKV